jgi:hypothetical protein
VAGRRRGSALVKGWWRSGKICQNGQPRRRTDGGERRSHWTSSAGEVPGARLHKLRRTKGVPRDLLNGERKL